jgi:hypothetical protein
VIGRLVLVAAAAVAIAFFATRLHDDGRCTSAQRTVFRVTVRRAPAAQLGPALEQLRGSCKGSAALVSAAGGLTFSGRARQAAMLAREATRAEPDNWAAWAALVYAVRRTDPAAAAAARARVLHLNPRYRFAASPPR